MNFVQIPLSDQLTPRTLLLRQIENHLTETENKKRKKINTQNHKNGYMSLHVWIYALQKKKIKN